MEKRLTLLILVSLSLMLTGIYLARLTQKTNSLKKSVSSTQKIPPTQAVNPQPKIFKSKNLDFTVSVPNEFVIREAVDYVEFSKGKNSIKAERRSHKFNTIDEFISSTKKNETKDTTEIKKLEINGFPTRIKDEIKESKTIRIYYIFTPNWVYSFSTNSESLYTDIDQITQSFQYIPDQADTTTNDNEKTEIQTL